MSRGDAKSRPQSRRARLAPLVLATMASQALLVVLSPTIAAVADDLGTSVAAAGQARSVTAVVAVAVSLAITSRIAAVGVSRLIAAGAGLATVACAAVAAAPSLPAFLAAHVLVGAALALLVTAGFAGVTGLPAQERAWAVGYVAGANALAWIVVNPVVGSVTQWVSWRAAEGVPAVIAIAAGLLRRASPSPGAQQAPLPLRLLVADASARRWIGAELLAYGAWTGLLTFIGAFFVERIGVGEAVVGWFLAAGAAAYFAASTRSGALVARIRRRWLAAASALAMAALLPVLLNLDGAGAFAGVAVFCVVGLTGGIRTPASSGLGLDQLPDHPGAMAAARTGATQLGYLLGALVGGVVIAAAGYGALGGALAVGMAVSAVLVLRVRDPLDDEFGILSPSTRA